MDYKKFINTDMAACKYYINHDSKCGEFDTKKRCCDIDSCYFKALAVAKEEIKFMEAACKMKG